MVIAVDAVSPEAHGHVDVPVGGLQGGWEEPDDVGRADFAAGGAHLNIDALQVQTSEHAIFNLKWKKIKIISDFPVNYAATKIFLTSD